MSQLSSYSGRMDENEDAPPKGFILAPFQGQVAVFDCTVRENCFDDYRMLADTLRTIAKKWVFQLEVGAETGYRHWQIRLSLQKKTRFGPFSKECMPVFPGCWSVTTSTVAKSGTFDYVMKVQTREGGPWKDTDKDLRPPPVLTRQLRDFMEKPMYPWQKDVKEFAETYDERIIHFIYDPHYNSGKSVFTEYLEYCMIAEEIPSTMALGEDVMQFVMSQHTSQCYIFDMPAAMKKQNVNQLYTAFEMLKNGFLYDKRYSGKKRRIDRPAVIIFSNDLPKQSLMAPDRYRTYYIRPDKTLVVYDALKHPVLS